MYSPASRKVRSIKPSGVVIGTWKARDQDASDCFSRNFSLLGGVGGNVPMATVILVGRAAATNISRSTFLHLPVMPNRCIARMTLTWLQAPRPRWVGGNAPVAAVYSALALPSLAR